MRAVARSLVTLQYSSEAAHMPCMCEHSPRVYTNPKPETVLLWWLLPDKNNE